MWEYDLQRQKRPNCITGRDVVALTSKTNNLFLLHEDDDV